MKEILDRIVSKINSAEIDPRPSDNIYIEEIFEPAFYAEILARLPADNEFDFIKHPDAVLPDGTITRKLLDLTDETLLRLKPADRDFWQKLNNILTSETLQQVLANKFREKITERYGVNWPDMVTVPIFYRDYAGYRISEHTDAPYKIMTMQFYFPKDESQIHLGTSFHEKENDGFKLLKTNPFKPNSAYAFVRTDNSWHSVKQLAAHESKRDSLALTIYLKGHEYKSTKNYM